MYFILLCFLYNTLLVQTHRDFNLHIDDSKILAFQPLELLSSYDLFFHLNSATYFHGHGHKNLVSTQNCNPFMNSFLCISLPDHHPPFQLIHSGTQNPSHQYQDSWKDLQFISPTKFSLFLTYWYFLFPPYPAYPMVNNYNQFTPLYSPISFTSLLLHHIYYGNTTTLIKYNLLPTLCLPLCSWMWPEKSMESITGLTLNPHFKAISKNFLQALNAAQ